MTDSTPIPQRSEHRPSPWLFVPFSLMALVLSVLVVARFAFGLGAYSFVALPGTLTGIVTAVICIWAFLQCPRRPLLPKLLTFLVLIPSLYIGIYCLSTYLMFGLRR